MLRKGRNTLESQALRPQVMVVALKRLAGRLGPNVTLARFCREYGISKQKVYARFDDWSQLRKSAGLPGQGDRSSYTREGLIATVREAADALGEELSLPEFVRQTGISPRPIERLFGNWTALKAAAGLTRRRKPGPRPRLTKDELLAELRRVTTERGDVSLRAFCRELDVSPSTIERLGAWGELRHEAGLPRRARTGRPLWQTKLAGDLFDPQTERPADLPGAMLASRSRASLPVLSPAHADAHAAAQCDHETRHPAQTEMSVPPVDLVWTSPSVGGVSVWDDEGVGGSVGGVSAWDDQGVGGSGGGVSAWDDEGVGGSGGGVSESVPSRLAELATSIVVSGDERAMGDIEQHNDEGPTVPGPDCEPGRQRRTGFDREPGDERLDSEAQSRTRCGRPTTPAHRSRTRRL